MELEEQHFLPRLQGKVLLQHLRRVTDLVSRQCQLDETVVVGRKQRSKDACTREPTCEEAWAFRGDVALGFSRLEEAEDAYRKAYKLAPKNKRYAEQIKAVLGLKAKAAK